MRISYTSKKEAYADLLHIKNYSTPAFNVFVSSREQKERVKAHGTIDQELYDLKNTTLTICS